MGCGILSGEVSSIWIYLTPMNGSFFVIAFHMSIFAIFSLGTYWLFLKNGAEFLTTHPGIFNLDLKSTHKVKLIWVLGLVFGLVSFAMMLFADIPQAIL